MFHVERKHHAAIYQKLANALATAPGSCCRLVGRRPDEEDDSVEGFTSEMFGQTFYYSGFAPEVTRKMIEAAGFEIELWEVDDPTSRGHIAVIARKLAPIERKTNFGVSTNEWVWSGSKWKRAPNPLTIWDSPHFFPCCRDRSANYRTFRRDSLYVAEHNNNYLCFFSRDFFVAPLALMRDGSGAQLPLTIDSRDAAIDS